MQRLSGDPDLFASVDHQYPSWFDSTWKSVGLQDDAVLIFNASQHYTWPQTVYISVNAFVDTARATLEVTTGQVNVTEELREGNPAFGTVETATLQYYTLYNARVHSSKEKIVFSLDEQVGSSDIYVAECTTGLKFPRLQQKNGRYQVANYDKAGHFNGAQITAQFSPTVATNLTVAVFGDGIKNAVNRFSLLATREGSDAVIPLPFGRKRDDSVGAGDYIYYQLKLTEDKKDVAVQTESERLLHLYGSSQEGVSHVTKQNEEYSAITGLEGIANLRIPYSGLSTYCRGRLGNGSYCLLAISAHTEGYQASYTIEASYSNSKENPLPLPVSEAYSGALRHGHYDYFVGVLDLSRNETIHFNLFSCMLVFQYRSVLRTMT